MLDYLIKSSEEQEKYLLYQYALEYYRVKHFNEAPNGRTEIRRKWRWFRWDKWKIFLDGKFIGYIKNGETKLIDKQGVIFIDGSGYFNEDGTQSRISRFFRFFGYEIDTAPSAFNSKHDVLGSSLAYYLCDVSLKKSIINGITSNEYANNISVKLKFKTKEFIPLSTDPEYYH